MVTASDIKGRLRIRDEHLRDPFVAGAVQDALAALPEIHEARVGTRAGSLLVLYHDSEGVRDRIMSRIGLHLLTDKGHAASLGGGGLPDRRLSENGSGASFLRRPKSSNPYVAWIQAFAGMKKKCSETILGLAPSATRRKSSPSLIGNSSTLWHGLLTVPPA